MSTISQNYIYLRNNDYTQNEKLLIS